MEPLNQPAERLQPGNSPPRIFRVLIVAIPWLVLATVFYFAFTGDWFSAWQKVRVTPLHTPFLDLQGFPTGLQVYRQGGDPLIANPLDPRKRPLNYPRLMMFLFAALGITQKNLPLFGVLLCALYLTCITALIWRARSRLEAVLLLVASLSAAPLLAVELGNTDVLIFSLVFFAFLFRKKILGPAILFAAALLKIYPFAALIVHIAFPPRTLKKLPAACAVLALAVFAWRWREIDAIRRGTPISPIVSFGVLAIRKSVSFAALNQGLSATQSALAGWTSAAICWIAGLLAVFSAWRAPRPFEPQLLQSDAGQLFSLFAAIYVFSFGLGSNFDYRLIFLVPTIPLAVKLLKSRQNGGGSLLFLLLLLFVLNWLNTQYGLGLLLAHTATLAVFILGLRVLTEQLKSYAEVATRP